MSQADDPAEHRLHWLLDALRTGPRFRGESFGVPEPEVRRVLRALREALDRGEITVSGAIERLVRQLSRRMAEHRTTHRRAPSHRTACVAEPARQEVFEFSTGACVLPRRRDLALEAQPPWLWREIPAPCPCRPHRSAPRPRPAAATARALDGRADHPRSPSRADTATPEPRGGSAMGARATACQHVRTFRTGRGLRH